MKARKNYYVKKGKSGIVIANQKRRKHNLQRFIELTRSAIFTDCIIWVGKTDIKGYGQITQTDGTTVMAHIAFYELFVGQLQEDLEIDHTCNNPSCVNFEHLEAVTHSENMRRIRVRNPITHCKRGHEFSLENTYIDSRGKRSCKICRQNSSFLWKNKATLLPLVKNW